MSEGEVRHFPRGALIAAAALVGFTIFVAVTARLTGVGTTSMPAGETLAMRELRFIDGSDGSVLVFDANGGGQVAKFAPGDDGFARVVLRSLARERIRMNVGSEPPFRLTQRTDQRMTLEDPVTGQRVHLGAFGPANAAVFQRLMNEQRSEVR